MYHKLQSNYPHKLQNNLQILLQSNSNHLLTICTKYYYRHTSYDCCNTRKFLQKKLHHTTLTHVSHNPPNSHSLNASRELNILSLGFIQYIDELSDHHNMVDERELEPDYYINRPVSIIITIIYYLCFIKLTYFH